MALPKTGVTVTVFGSTVRHGFDSSHAGAVMDKVIQAEMKRRVEPEIRAAYNKMTENWSESPTPTITLSRQARLGNVLTVKFLPDSNANKKWIMVDTEGRRGGKSMTAKIKYAEDTIDGKEARLTPVREREFFYPEYGGGKAVPIGFGKQPHYAQGPIGVANRPRLRWLNVYASKTTAGGGFGGSGDYSGQWKSAFSVPQSSVDPRFLTRNNIIPALQGKSSPLSGIIKPWLTDSGPARAAYRKAIEVITGKRI